MYKNFSLSWQQRLSLPLSHLLLSGGDVLHHSSSLSLQCLQEFAKAAPLSVWETQTCECVSPVASSPLTCSGCIQGYSRIEWNMDVINICKVLLLLDELHTAHFYRCTVNTCTMPLSNETTRMRGMFLLITSFNISQDSSQIACAATWAARINV